ncbi:ATP-binding protein [Anaerolineales bacterium HSG24]|nr:ATP-binding protein [Anaerolineales bacterium HSG24]
MNNFAQNLDNQENLFQIEQAKQEWETTADALPQLVCLLDEQQRIIRINRTVEQWELGLVTQVQGKTLSELLHPAIPASECYLTPLLANAWPKLVVGESIDTEVEDIILGRYFNILIEPIQSSDNYQLTSFAVVVIHDITKRKTLEVQLNHAQKMEAIGRLTSGIAHDFNNILMAIMGDCELLLSYLGPEHQELVDIKQNVERGTLLTKQMLTFGRKKLIRSTIININDALSNMDRLINRLVGKTISLNCQRASELPVVKIASGQLEQIIINLIVNARDAMPQGGELTIQTGQAEVIPPSAKQENYVFLAVSDTGTGIDRATLSHIFDPFFTTKQLGHGTGLGLATVHSVVEQNDGYVTVDSEVGQGTTFTVYFPIVQNDSPDLPSSTVPPVTSIHKSNGERVLVVDDESSILHILQKSLTKQGYETLIASHGSDALDLVEANPEPIQLLITDMILPEGMSGYQLANQLKQKYPEMKTLFISGYADQELFTNLKPWMDFLSKPFELKALEAKMQAFLEK